MSSREVRFFKGLRAFWVVFLWFLGVVKVGEMADLWALLEVGIELGRWKNGVNVYVNQIAGFPVKQKYFTM